MNNLESIWINLSLEDHRKGNIGDSEHAFHYLKVAARYIQEGNPLPEVLKIFISSALLKIAEGGDPKDAFFLKQKRGKKTIYDDIGIAEIMIDFVKNTSTIEAAVEEKQKYFRNTKKPIPSDRVVTEAYYKYREALENRNAA